MNRAIAIKTFLGNKNLTISDCTKRQLQILKTESPGMWPNYQWDL